MKYNTLIGSAALLCALPLMVAAQEQAPSQSFGITTGLVYNDNRGLDDTSQGSTTEFFTRLDVGLVFGTPIQSLTINGDLTLRGLDGAEAGNISDGLTDPNLRLRYNRQARNAQLTVSAFAREAETQTQVAELDGLDLVLVSDDATRLTYGYDAELELRREAPFGITLSHGFTGLRYSDTTSTSLRDQDRYQFGAAFRFDLNPVLQALVNTRYSTFEEDGSAAGLRETYALDASLRQTLPDGLFGVTANITSVEEGERYSLSLERRVEREAWSLSGDLGLTHSVSGDTFPTATLDARYTLPNGSLGLNLNHAIRSGLSDNEQEFSAIRFNYLHNLDTVSSLSVNLNYSETNPTGTGGTSSLGTIGLGYQRELAPGWQMNVGLDRRVSTNSAGATARDNRLSLSVRRALFARR